MITFLSDMFGVAGEGISILTNVMQGKWMFVGVAMAVLVVAKLPYKKIAAMIISLVEKIPSKKVRDAILNFLNKLSKEIDKSIED